VIVARVGDGVRNFLPSLLRRDRPNRLQGRHGSKPCCMVRRTCSALLAIGEASCSPGWPAFWCRDGSALRHADMMPLFALVGKSRELVTIAVEFASCGNEQLAAMLRDLVTV
jgi:hypothetical protein